MGKALVEEIHNRLQISELGTLNQSTLLHRQEGGGSDGATQSYQRLQRHIGEGADYWNSGCRGIACNITRLSQ